MANSIYLSTDDIELWQACKKGNKHAFEKLYKLFYPMLYNYGYKFTSDKDIILDCIQSLFLKLIRNREHLSDPPSLKGYLLKAFRNMLYDVLKREQTKNDLIKPLSPENILFFESQNIKWPEEESKSQNFLFIQRAFVQLSSRQQEIIYLYYIAEISHDDIASILNINYQSSKNLLFRSIAILRKNFQKEADRARKEIRPTTHENEQPFTFLTPSRNIIIDLQKIF